MKAVSRAISLFAALALGFGAAWGHEEPFGEIRPVVWTSDGTFVVDFYLKTADEYAPFARQRRVFSSAGELVQEPQEPVDRRLQSPSSFRLRDESFRQLPPGLRRGLLARVERCQIPWLLCVRDASSTLHFTLGSLPTAVYSQRRDGLLERFTQMGHSVAHVEDFIVAGDEALILGRPPSSLPGRTRAVPDEETPLAFFAITDGPGGASRRIDIGYPVIIMTSFVASNLVVWRNHCFVSWVDRQERLMLSIWSVASASAQSRVIQGRVSWNTSPSMANIGRHLLLAWHEGEGDYPGRNSRIKVTVRDLAETAGLPALEADEQGTGRDGPEQAPRTAAPRP